MLRVANVAFRAAQTEAIRLASPRSGATGTGWSSRLGAGQAWSGRVRGWLARSGVIGLLWWVFVGGAAAWRLAGISPCRSTDQVAANTCFFVERRAIDLISVPPSQKPIRPRMVCTTTMAAVTAAPEGGVVQAAEPIGDQGTQQPERRPPDEDQGHGDPQSRRAPGLTAWPVGVRLRHCRFRSPGPGETLVSLSSERIPPE